jgi:hypothetical protein
VARIEQRPGRFDLVAAVNRDLLDGQHARESERARDGHRAG